MPTAENQWLHLPLITKLRKSLQRDLPRCRVRLHHHPHLPQRQIGFMVCCKDANRNVREPLRKWSAEEEEKLCKYYNADIHKAAFVLPNFAKKALQ
ncbi:spermidine synthase [Verticillium dahliae VdLs.17]|uniref:Spermidine synthase n=1 Tax=Verticillium dahliae (strain VdLs.17 / ATCC MYA-4575 / FGSC 10137) TaxID=498257 RepID=G2WRE8_VERDV|nr:spermidine synthase [Verticillium dahliae VdLs.17]EGY13449.1 spermidine synthase [Verticillium dahliae VdLs.17]